jgi:hypothetical protein
VSINGRFWVSTEDCEPIRHVLHAGRVAGELERDPSPTVSARKL